MNSNISCSTFLKNGTFYESNCFKNVYQLRKATGKYRKYQMSMLGMNFLL